MERPRRNGDLRSLELNLPAEPECDQSQNEIRAQVLIT